MKVRRPAYVNTRLFEVLTTCFWSVLVGLCAYALEVALTAINWIGKRIAEVSSRRGKVSGHVFILRDRLRVKTMILRVVLDDKVARHSRRECLIHFAIARVRCMNGAVEMLSI